MKTIVLAFALAAMGAAPAFAQTATPAPAFRQQMMQLHQQLRAQVLNALTPQHRTLLASIAGGLASSAAPDYNAAAAKLDAALTPGEKQAILSAVNTMRSRMQSMNGASGMQGAHPMMQGAADPGRMLLMISMMPAGGMMMERPPMR